MAARAAPTTIGTIALVLELQSVPTIDLMLHVIAGMANS